MHTNQLIFQMDIFFIWGVRFRNGTWARPFVGWRPIEQKRTRRRRRKQIGSTYKTNKTTCGTSKGPAQGRVAGRGTITVR